ncbi:MAG: sodium/solute symporter [Cytophagales bacterium]|nr:sodium/solute symporter [Cytophagales bacterium]
MKVWIILIFVFFNHASAQTGWLNWEQDSIPDLPFSKGLSGAFIGIHNEVLIVAGGSYFNKSKWDGGQKVYLDSIYICKKYNGKYEWSFAGLLPYQAAHGVAIKTKDGLVCAGGESASGKLSKVITLSFDANTEKLIIQNNLAELPQSVSHISGASLDGKLFLAGGFLWKDSINISINTFLMLDLQFPENGWVELVSWPGAPRGGASMVTQTNGDYACLYLFGGKNESEYLQDAYSYDFKRKPANRWKTITNIPRPAYVAPVLPIGLSQIWVASGSDGHDVEKLHVLKDKYNFITDIQAYNTITDTWYRVGDLPQGLAATSAVLWEDKIVIPGGEIRPGVRTPRTFTASILRVNNSNFHIIDYLTLIGYLGLIAWLGYYFSKQNKDSKDFFLGGQKIPFWAAGLSMMAAQVSSIGFMAIPAKAFATNWAYFAGVFTWFIVVPLVIYAFVPFYRRLNVTSAYEYLEKRFSPFIRLFIAGLYLLFQLLGRLGAIIFLPAIALSSVTGMDTIACILIIGALATLYTALGGMSAVIWIDVIQAFVLFGGIILIIIYILFNIEGGLGTFTQIAWTDHKFSLGNFDMNLTMAVFWVIIVGNIFSRVGTMATDQSVVQRYLTTKNEEETAKALWMDVSVSIPWAMLVFGLGTALYVFYKLNPSSLDPLLTNDGIVPFFIGQNLPVGISGVIIAGIFAAAMSSVDSSIHSSTTVIMRDFLSRALDLRSEKYKVRMAQWMVVILGILGTLIALAMTLIDITSVWDIILEVASLFIGAMTGLFLLGIFTKSANATGAIVGAILSAVLLLSIKQYTEIHFFLYAAIGIISCFTFGFLSSLLFPSNTNHEGLTIYSVREIIEGE